MKYETHKKHVRNTISSDEGRKMLSTKNQNSRYVVLDPYRDMNGYDSSSF